MKHTHLTVPGRPWLCFAVTAWLLAGCTQPTWDGVFTVDKTGGARTCVAPSTSPPDGQSSLVQLQVSNEGGWCGMTLNRGGVAYDSYLLLTRPSHGKVFAHHVGTKTRIDYTPDPGFVGTDNFAVRLIPGNAVLQGAIAVTR